MWTIFVIGILFCLVDVVYIIGFVERQKLVQEVRPVEQSSQHQSKVKSAVPVSKSDGKEIGDEGAEEDYLADKEPILNLLIRAGVKVDLEEDKDLIQELPTWSEVVSLYGSKPVIHGLEECERFQNMSDRADHFVSTAGTFNSGTNLMAELLIANCHMQARMDKYGAPNRGVRWQVPW
jgi:hypothetical protein